MTRGTSAAHFYTLYTLYTAKTAPPALRSLRFCGYQTRARHI